MKLFFSVMTKLSNSNPAVESIVKAVFYKLLKHMESMSIAKQGRRSNKVWTEQVCQDVANV